MVLAAAAAQSITVTGRGPLRVVNWGSGAAFVDASGAVAVAAADDTYVVAPGAARIIDLSDKDGTMTVSAISTAGTNLTIEQADKIGMGY